MRAPAAAALQEYPARQAARRASLDTLTSTDARLSHARLATFALGVLLALLAWNGVVSTWWLLAPVAAFVWLLRRHAQVLRARTLALRGVAFYDRGLARVEDRWVGTGEPGDRFLDEAHVYANDLDLFGRGSLFELLSLARTRNGEAMLARWLVGRADPPEIRARQAAVEELSLALNLREQLALAGADVRTSVDTVRLLEWAESAIPSPTAFRLTVWGFTAATLLGIVSLALTSAWWPLLVVMAGLTLLHRWFRHDMNVMLSASDPGLAADFVADTLTNRALELDIVSELLAHLERARFDADRLVVLRGRLDAGGLPASSAIRRLHRLSELYDSQKNTAAIPILLFLAGAYTGQDWLLDFALGVAALLLLARPVIALAVARWRSRFGARVREWVETVAEFEALSSLAGYRYERPGDVFPEVVTGDSAGAARAVFDGVQLGHPLLPRARLVRNDVHLAGDTRLLVVSGSNMSGKSTLLRTVGINAVLALAGAPVCASALRLSPLAVGATIRIQDSLLEGRSRFYAEIVRIRELVDIASGPVPLLFLLDELFHGTNSHDRVRGADGVLRSLLDRGAIGLITTHDLALTTIAEGVAPRAVNVHFQDWFEQNEMTFDYRMKPGPVTRSNAIALMRAVGLEVAEAAR
jgi:hypothetical protein